MHEPPPTYEPRPAYAAIEEEDDWLEEPEELPRRPRRRLLGGPDPARAARRAADRLRVHRRRARREGPDHLELLRRRRGRPGIALRRAARGHVEHRHELQPPERIVELERGFTRPTAGTVAYLAGSTLYVTNSEGNTVKVTTSAGTSVTKTVKASVKGIHPGETVTVTGATGSSGAVSAESISVGSGGGGLAALFGGRGSSSGSTGGSSGSGKPSLFGSGG